MIVYILLVIIVVQDFVHYIERKDLYKRIMCHDIREYNKKPEKGDKTTISAHQKALDNWRKRGEDT